MKEVRENEEVVLAVKASERKKSASASTSGKDEIIASTVSRGIISIELANVKEVSSLGKKVGKGGVVVQVMIESQNLLRKILLNGGNPAGKIKNLELNFDHLVEDYPPKINPSCFSSTNCNLETKESAFMVEVSLLELSSLA